MNNSRTEQENKPTKEVMAMKRLSEEICEVIFSSTFLNKAEIQPRIYSLLKAYTHQVNRPAALSKPASASKVDRYVKTIYRRDLEVKSWKEELVKVYTPEQMREFYRKQTQILIDNAVYKIE